MNITREQAAAIDREIDAAVEAILTKHGLQRGKRRSQYGSHYRYTVEAVAVVTGDNGVNMASKEAQAWMGNAPYLGFADPAAALGKTFTSNGHTYTLMGYRPRAHKRPVVAQNAHGNMFAFPLHVLHSIEGYDQRHDSYALV